MRVSALWEQICNPLFDLQGLWKGYLLMMWCIQFVGSGQQVGTADLYCYIVKRIISFYTIEM